jgi:hypothetical protein
VVLRTTVSIGLSLRKEMFMVCWTERGESWWSIYIYHHHPGAAIPNSRDIKIRLLHG